MSILAKKPPENFPNNSQKPLKMSKSQLCLRSPEKQWKTEHKLKEKSAAKVILGTALRTKNGFSLIFRDLDTIMSNGPEEALTGINRAIEESIIGNEAQYLWEYKRFKCRPAGEVDHYG